MARTFVSPMGDPTFAAAAQNLAEALFPSAGRMAQIQQAGAQYQGQVLNNRQTELENTGLERQNQGWNELGGVITDPKQLAVLRAGGGNANTLAGAIGQFLEQQFRQGARDKAVAGDYNGANGELFGVANGPVQTNVIDNGYNLNPYDTTSKPVATGKTLAEIATEAAQARNYDASAGAASALEAQRRDETAHPEKYGKGGKGKTPDVSPSEVAGLDKLLGNYIPPNTDMDPAARNEALSRASELYQQTGNAQDSVARAIEEVFGSTSPTPDMSQTTRAPTIMDGPWDWMVGNQQPTGQKPVLRAKPPLEVGGSNNQEAKANTAAASVDYIEKQLGRPLTAAERTQVASGDFNIRGAAAPTGGGAATVPPPAQRKPGQVYDTPKGPLKWTGTGWVKP